MPGVARALGKVVALSGGTGSAKFLRGLLELSQFTVVANVGDDAWFHGLRVCPDIDTVTYTLAGLGDSRRGWGIEGDGFAALEQLERLGEEGTWFKIGDRDMATHLFRTKLLGEGRSLTEATSAIADALGVRGCKILPATEARVETRIATKEKGELHLQEFWVREKGTPTPAGVRYVGAASARPTAAVLRSIASAERIVFCPANPVTSIMPILAIAGVRGALRRSRARKVAVSPMLGRAAFSGPAARLMAALGFEPSSAGVTRLYRGLLDAIVLDESDRDLVPRISATGVSCRLAPTLMRTRTDEVRLAKVAMEA